MKYTNRILFTFVFFLLSVQVSFGMTLIGSYGFSRITNNAGTDIANQLSFNLYDLGNSQIRFDIFNNVGISSSIAGIYFDDDEDDDNDGILSFNDVPSNLIESSGVDFSFGTTPSDLPGGAGIGFTKTFKFLAESPPSQKGINANSEYLGIVFDLKSGITTQTVIDDIASGDLRIGLHVISIGQYSDSFVNTPSNPVPEPASVVLLGLGLLGFGFYRRRK